MRWQLSTYRQAYLNIYIRRQYYGCQLSTHPCNVHHKEPSEDEPRSFNIISVSTRDFKLSTWLGVLLRGYAVQSASVVSL